MRNKMKSYILATLLSFMSAAQAGELIQPSSELLKLAKIDDFEISKNVKVFIGDGKTKTNKGYDLCENSSHAWVTVNSRFQNVKKITVVAESEGAKSTLFSVNNMNGMSNNAQITKTLINLTLHSPNHINVWAFVTTDEGVFAGSTQARCVLKEGNI